MVEVDSKQDVESVTSTLSEKSVTSNLPEELDGFLHVTDSKKGQSEISRQKEAGSAKKVPAKFARNGNTL